MSDPLLPDGSVALLVSADTARSLTRDAAAIADYLASHADVVPSDVARMLFRTRDIRRHRALVRALDRQDAIAALRAVAAGTAHPDATVSKGPATSRRAALVFPGQGSQRAGMGRAYYEQSEVYRRRVDEINAEFAEVVGITPLDYLLDAEHIEDVKVVQPAIFLQTLGLARMWRDAGVEPVATIGHSQGEIAAVVEAGLLSLRDGIRVVAGRAVQVECVELSADYVPCAMAVVGARREQIEDRLARHSGWAELAVVNSTTIHALSGFATTIDALVAQFRAEGIFARRIGVDYPGHTSELRRYARQFSGAAAGVEADAFGVGDLLCIGATLGEPITPDLPMSEYWSWNLRNTVRFDYAVAAAVQHGIDTFIEVSEHPTMLLSIGETLAEQGVGGVVVGTGSKNVDPLSEFVDNFAAVAVADSEFQWPATDSGDILLDFPHSGFDDATYWAADALSAAVR